MNYVNIPETGTIDNGLADLLQETQWLVENITRDLREHAEFFGIFKRYRDWAAFKERRRRPARPPGLAAENGGCVQIPSLNHGSPGDRHHAQVSDVFGGPYLKADYYRAKPQTWTIEGWGIEVSYGKEEYVLSFAGEKKGLKLSQTCANDIAEVLGDDMGGWSGHAMEFYAEDRTKRDTGETFTMWRARAAATPSAKLPPRRPPFDDDIPF